MNSSIEVVVVCVTGMVCDAIADALECDSIKVKTRASTIADIDAAQLKDTVVIYIWGGGDDEFAADVTPSFPPAGIRAGRLFCA